MWFIEYRRNTAGEHYQTEYEQDINESFMTGDDCQVKQGMTLWHLGNSESPYDVVGIERNALGKWCIILKGKYQRDKAYEGYQIQADFYSTPNPVKAWMHKRVTIWPAVLCALNLVAALVLVYMFG